MNAHWCTILSGDQWKTTLRVLVDIALKLSRNTVAYETCRKWVKKYRFTDISSRLRLPLSIIIIAKKQDIKLRLSDTSITSITTYRKSLLIF